MSVSVLSLLGAALAGALVGAAYLGLLWVAVRRLPEGRNGVPFFIAMAVVRAALILGALAAAAALGVPALGILAALAGFTAVRIAATRFTGRRSAGEIAWK